MAKHRVGVLEPHETPELCSPSIFCGQAIAERIVAEGSARRIGKRLIQMLHHTAAEAIRIAKAARDLAAKQAEQIVHAFWDGPFGIGNLLPFSKHQNPLMFPERLHYPHPGGRCPRALAHGASSDECSGLPRASRVLKAFIRRSHAHYGSARQRTPSYIRALADRGYGKVPQHLGLENPDGAPLNFNLNVKFIASRHKKQTSSGQS